ncbi:meiosis-specific nuclear structural protein 1-like [Pectinophora gossypiella]|nr:meiosis-specific nuclear structural protein 1-like [Pectinophora gossypiella]
MEVKTELQKNAIALARRKELEIFQRALDVQWMNNRMEDGRMGRCLALIRREADMEKNFQERTDHAAIVNTKAARETALGMEIAKVQREETCKYMRRHYLRERDPSLRHLATKLQAGYVCRDLQQQILHNEYRRLQEKAEEKRANDVLRASLYSDIENEEIEDRLKAEQCSKYGQELMQQLVSRQRQKQCQYEDTLIEKKMLDEILRTIADEDKREFEQKRELMKKTREEMVTFKKAQDAWRAKQKQMVILEEKEIERQKQAMSDRDEAVVAARQRRLAEKEAINAKIAAKLLADEDARQERDNIIKLLQEQEYLEKNINDEIAENEKTDRVKQETKEALTKQIEEKKRLAQEQRAREVDFRRQTEAKIRADEEKEREKQRRIREKNKKHCAELLVQAEAHRQLIRNASEDEANRARAVKEYERKWEEEVAEERKKIVREHVPHLLGYLQAGVIKKTDLPQVREGANKHPELANLNIEALTQSQRPKRFAKCNAQCFILREY